MDYKKKYKEALERAKDFMNGEVHYALRRGENIMCWIFPELRESEDERIVKSFIRLLKAFHDVNFPTPEGFERKDMIAWLEKQGEQTCKDEHKHAWSENDEIALGDALWCCKQAAIIAKDENDMGNIWYAERWLKSIKERIQPQQERSEEDSMFIKILRTMIAAYVKDDEERKKLVRWLDIHCNAYPIPNKLYPSWKPSDEQMKALDDFIYAKYPNTEKHGAAVKSLYQDLKKLMEE